MPRSGLPCCCGVAPNAVLLGATALACHVPVYKALAERLVTAASDAPRSDAPSFVRTAPPSQRLRPSATCGSGQIRGLAVSKIFLAFAGASVTPENMMVTRSSPVLIINPVPTAMALSPMPA